MHVAETKNAAGAKATETNKKEQATTKAKTEATTTEKQDAKPSTTQAASHKTSEKASSSHTKQANNNNESATPQASSTASNIASSKAGMSFNGFSPSSTHVASATVSSSTPSSSFSSASNASSSDSSGISGGAVAGIVIAVLACVAGIGAFLIVRKRRAAARQREQLYKKPDPFTMGFGSHDPPPPHAAYMTNTQPMIQMPPIAASTPATNTYQNNAQYQDQNAYGSSGQYTQNVYPSQPHQSYTPALAGVAAAGTAVTTPAAVTPEPASPPQPPQTPPMQSLGVYTVVSTYTPTLSDEIDIQPGDKVEILIEYDDGWCQGINLSRGNIKGVFPRHCVAQTDDNDSNAAAVRPSLQLNGNEIEKLKRVSSMLGAPHQ